MECEKIPRIGAKVLLVIIQCGIFNRKRRYNLHLIRNDIYLFEYRVTVTKCACTQEVVTELTVWKQNLKSVGA